MDAINLGFIGAGKMAESIARGVAKSGVLPPSNMRTAHRSSDRCDVFLSIGVKVFHHNTEVVESSDVVILSVKPQVGPIETVIATKLLFHPETPVPTRTLTSVKKVLLDLKPLLSKDKLLVSIAAGIKLKDLQEWAGHGRLIRVMPNTPSAVGEAAAVMCLGDIATKEDEKLVESIFGAVGKVWRADEKCFDAVTGLSGSGPAYMFLAIEAMADGGVAAGLPRDLALKLASQTVLGAAAMAINSGKHPGQLKDDVASPAGTTMAGIRELENGGFRATLINAVVAAANRSRELSDK